MRKIEVTVLEQITGGAWRRGSLARRGAGWGRRVPSSSGALGGSFRGLKFTMNKSKSVGLFMFFLSPGVLGGGMSQMNLYLL